MSRVSSKFGDAVVAVTVVAVGWLVAVSGVVVGDVDDIYTDACRGSV